MSTNTHPDPAPGPAQSSSPSRRTLLKLGAASLPVSFMGASPPLQAKTITSPATTPFLEPLPIMPVLPSRPLSDAAFALQPPSQNPNRAINPATLLPFEGRGDSHQLREKNPPQYFYAQRFGAVPPVSIHPQLSKQVCFWGANMGGSDLRTDRPMTPLPTIVSRYKAGTNTAILVRRFNDLPMGIPSGGFGKNSISTHTHNFHSAPDSDGGPCDPGLGALAEDPRTQGRFFFPGQYYDYYYNMKRAGFTNAKTPDGDVRESLGTMWYHDHREAHTAENVYKGLAGFHLVFNEHDTGDETTGFRLPSFPRYDIPLLITDLLIDPMTGQATIDLLDNDGHLGDKYVANGKVQPYLSVARRRYRLRCLNASPSRYQALYLVNPDNPAQVIPFWRISNDGNLYESPLLITEMKLAPAERGDLILDFAALCAPNGPAAGATRLWLENRLIQTDPRNPSKLLAPPGTAANAIVELRVGATAPDASRDPAQISSFAPITLAPLAKPVVTRYFKWGRKNGAWVCNGQPLDCTKIRFTMKRGRMERWIHETGDGWAHPVHNHFVEGRIISRNGLVIGPGSQEYCRKDIVALYPSDKVEYWVNAVDYQGVYPMHCHNVLHEDYGMMLLYRVNDTGDTNPEP